MKTNSLPQSNINESTFVNDEFDALNTENIELMMRLIDYIFWEQDRGEVIPS